MPQDPHPPSGYTQPGAVVQTKSGSVYLRADGIMKVDLIPNRIIQIEEAIELIQAQEIIAGGVRRPLLVDLRSIQSINRPARVYLGGEEAAKNVSATALHIKSLFSQIIGNFMIGMNKTLYPTALFVSEEQALEWLAGFMKHP